MSYGVVRHWFIVESRGPGPLLDRVAISTLWACQRATDRETAPQGFSSSKRRYGARRRTECIFVVAVDVMLAMPPSLRANPQAGFTAESGLCRLRDSRAAAAHALVSKRQSDPDLQNNVTCPTAPSFESASELPVPQSFPHPLVLPTDDLPAVASVQVAENSGVFGIQRESFRASKGFNESICPPASPDARYNSSAFPLFAVE